MLERRRKSKHYEIVPAEEGDVELGEGAGITGQETGVISTEASGEVIDTGKKTNVTEELDHWHGNAEDWEEDAAHTAAAATENGDMKK